MIHATTGVARTTTIARTTIGRNSTATAQRGQP
jgi:hypothetical protein